MEKYIYRPVRFYLITFACTWFWWLFAILLNEGTGLYLGMFLGLVSPAVVAVVTVFTSKNKALINDFKKKLIGFYRIKPKYILIAVLIFAVIVTASIGTSVLFGGSINQLSFTEDFSFSIGGTSAFLTILLASCIEELGWRGYGEDAVGAYNSWFKESIIFGCIWSLWHLPLFWIPGTYQYGLKEMGIMYVINFLLSVIPLDFLQTWVYVKNNRSKPTSDSDRFGRRYPEAKKYLVDALVDEITEIIQEGGCNCLVIPVALINDYCNQKLIDGFANIESHHFILTAKTEILHQRINNQENRDIDLAVTYMPEATQYLSNHYYDASIIDTSNMSIDSVAKEIIESITR